MITLHESNITTFPLNNGIGVLRDVIRAYAEEELNGMFEFYMEYDSEGHLVDELKEERIIKAKAQDKLGYQLFRIYSITKNHENDNLIVRGQHITYDLANNFVESLEARNLTKKQVMEKIGSSTVYPHPFNMTSSNTTTQSSTSLYRTNPLQMVGGMVGSVLQIWGGQIERDNFNLILHDRRGSDDGVKVTYEKNITGLEATFDISGLVTRIFPFVYLEATDDEPERLITVSGKYIDSPHINDYEKIYIEPIDYSSDERINTDGTDAQIRQQLTDIASQYFKDTGNDKIKVDMEVKFEHLWETEEYKDLAVLELVGMGDTVTINHSKLKVDVTAIVKYIRYDCIAEKNEEVRLGSVKAKLTDSVNRVVDVAEKVEQAQQTANQAIRAANGKNTIYYGPDEPEGGIEGDLWFRVVDGEYTRTYRHDGIQWQLVVDMDTSLAKQEAQQAKDDAQSAVDRANQATQQATDAINQAQTAFDEAQAALGTANNAMTQATSAFTTASEAFAEVESLSTMVDENTGEISTIKQSVSGLQTQVSDNAGNISSLTQIAQGLQTQVTDIEGNVTTLQQTAQGLQSSVANLQDELDGLEIGGRNLARGTNTTGWTYYSNGNVSFNLPLIRVECTRPTSGRFGIQQTSEYRLINLEAGQTYTLSFKARGTISHFDYVYIMNTGNANQSITSSAVINRVESETEFSFIQFTFKPNSNTAGNGQSYIMISTTGINGDWFEIKDIMIEKGNKATDWTPAPEDIDHQFSVITQTIDSITTRVGDAEGNITALQQTSSSLAGRLTDAEGNITTLTATVSGLQTTVTNVQGDVSSVTQLANALQTRMTNAEGNISTLTQTASSLQSTVSSLQDEWDNLDVGGRNLIPSTDFSIKENRDKLVFFGSVYSNQPYTVDGFTYQNFYTNANSSGTSAHVRTPYEVILKQGRVYTLSVVTIRRFLTVQLDRIWILVQNGTNYAINFETEQIGTTSEGHAMLRHVATFTHNREQQTISVQLSFSIQSNNSQPAAFGMLQIEEGNKATSWYPSYVDFGTQSQISQLSDAINLRVEKNDIINQINISTENILISGKKLILDGDTTVSGSFKVTNANILSLDAGKITTGTLDAGKISVINLSANSIVGGMLTSQNEATTFNLNTGDMDFSVNASIRFNGSAGGVRRIQNGRSAILSFPISAGSTTPMASLGVVAQTGVINVNDESFRGIRIHGDNVSHTNDIIGDTWTFSRRVDQTLGSIVISLGDTRKYISPQYSSTHPYDLGTGTNYFDRVYAQNIRVNSGHFTINNTHSTGQGFRFMMGYAGESYLALYGLNAGPGWTTPRYYALGKSSSRFSQIFLLNPPNVSSDERLKKDITDNILGLEFIKQVDTKIFRMNFDQPDNYLKTGVIAQQVLSVLNDFGIDTNDFGMVTKGDDGYYGVQYEQFIPTLIKSDQELDLKIESVKDDVEWLKLENQYLKQKVKQLEEMIA